MVSHAAVRIDDIVACLLRALRWGCACAVIAGLAATISAQSSQTIVEITVEGAREVEHGLILSTIHSKVGDRLDVNQITRDIKSLYDLSFFQDIEAYAEEVAEEGLRLIFVVKEKPRVGFVYIGPPGDGGIDDLVISGKLKPPRAAAGTTTTQGMDPSRRNLPATRSTSVRTVTVRLGSVFNPGEIERTIENMRAAYRAKGYFAVKITSRVESLSDGKKAIYIIVEETPRVYVTDIRTFNNHVFSELEIRRMMETAEVDCFDWITDSGVLDEAKINHDLRSISAQYLTQGYIRLFIEKPNVTIFHNPEFSRVKVEMHFREGAQYFTGNVDVTGDILGNKSDLLAALLLIEGDVYNPFTQNRDVFNLSAHYQEQGYAFVRVIPDASIDDERKIVDVTYRITKGEKAYIGRIEIQGNRETRDYVVRREFEVHENELYNGVKLRESQANLRRLGYFSPAMTVNTERTKVDNVLDVVTRLEETQTGTFQAQIGFSEQTQISVAVSLSKGNLFGRGQTLRLRAEAGQRGVRQNYSVDFIEPHLLDTEVGSDSSLSYRNLQDLTEQNRGNFEELRLSQGFNYPVFRIFRAGLTYEAINRSFDRVGNADVILRSLTPSITYNTVNHPIFPSDGTRITLSVSQVGGNLLGGSTEYRRYRARWQRFKSLNENDTVIVMGRLRFSWLEQVGNNEIPGEDRFRLGGITSLRAYNFLEIGGPFGSLRRNLNEKNIILLDANGDPVLDSDGVPLTTRVDKRTIGLSEAELEDLAGGGIFERLLNLELLFPLTGDNIRGLIFYDAGNVNSESNQYQLLGEKEPGFFDLKQSMGVGIRLITPLGVFRFEYGFKLAPEPGETPDKFDFTISTLF